MLLQSRGTLWLKVRAYLHFALFSFQQYNFNSAGIFWPGGPSCGDLLANSPSLSLSPAMTRGMRGNFRPDLTLLDNEPSSGAASKAKNGNVITFQVNVRFSQQSTNCRWSWITRFLWRETLKFCQDHAVFAWVASSGAVSRLWNDSVSFQVDRFPAQY